MNDAGIRSLCQGISAAAPGLAWQGRAQAMTKPMQPASFTAPYAFAWLLTGFSISGFATEISHINISGHYFAPFLAWWLGRRFGRRGLLPLLLAAPLLLPLFFVWPDDSTTIRLGLGPGMLVFCGALTLLAARPLDAPVGRNPGSLALAAAVMLLVTPLTFRMDTGGYSAGMTLSLLPIGLTPLAAFFFVFAGRVNLGPMTLILMAGAALGFGAQMMGLKGLDLGDGYGDSLSLSWGRAALPALALGLPAALAGAVLRKVLTEDRFDRRLWLAGLGGLILLPVIFQGAVSGAGWLLQPREVAGMAAGPGLAFLSYAAQPVDVVTVTATPAPSYVFGAGAFLMVLMALSLAAGLAGRGRYLYSLPAALVALGMVSLIGDYWIREWSGVELYAYDAWRLFEKQITALMATAIISWSACWFGLAMRPGLPGRGGQIAWPGM